MNINTILTKFWNKCKGKFSVIGHSHSKQDIVNALGYTPPTNTDGGNAASVNGLQAYQHETLDNNENRAGGEWVGILKHNVDGDGRWKWFTKATNGSTGSVRVDASTYSYTLLPQSNRDYWFNSNWNGSAFYTEVIAPDGGHKDVLVDQAKNADTLDGLHASSFLQTTASCNKNWNWYGQGGQPSWLWGGEDGTNMYVYNPLNFNVNYANSANVLSSVSIGYVHGDIGVDGNSFLCTVTYRKYNGKYIDVYIQGRFSALNSDPNNYQTFNSASLRYLLNVNSFDFNERGTSITITNKTIDPSFLGYTGLHLGKSTNGNYNLCRIHDWENQHFGGWSSANKGLLDTNAIYKIEIHNALYS